MLFSKQFAAVALIAITNLSGTFAIPQGSDAPAPAPAAPAAPASGSTGADLSGDKPADQYRQDAYDSKSKAIDSANEAVQTSYKTKEIFDDLVTDARNKLRSAEFVVEELKKALGQANQKARDSRGKWEGNEKRLRILKEELRHMKFDNDDARIKSENRAKDSAKKAEAEQARVNREKQLAEAKKKQADLEKQINEGGDEPKA